MIDPVLACGPLWPQGQHQSGTAGVELGGGRPCKSSELNSSLTSMHRLQGKCLGARNKTRMRPPSCQGGRNTASQTLLAPRFLLACAQIKTRRCPPSSPISCWPIPRHDAKHITFVLSFNSHYSPGKANTPLYTLCRSSN